MSLGSHLEELRKKHANLSEKVEDAQKSLGVPDLKITELKKQKLRIKEQIERLENA